VTIPGASGVVVRPGIETWAIVQVGEHCIPPMTVAPSPLPIVTSACAAGANASSANTATANLLIGGH
jgi:hypothetical protein